MFPFAELVGKKRQIHLSGKASATLPICIREQTRNNLFLRTMETQHDFEQVGTKIIWLFGFVFFLNKNPSQISKLKKIQFVSLFHFEKLYRITCSCCFDF